MIGPAADSLLPGNVVSPDGSCAGQSVLVVCINQERRLALFEGLLDRGVHVVVPSPASLAIDILRLCLSQKLEFRVIVLVSEGLANAQSLAALLKELYPTTLLLFVGQDPPWIGSALHYPADVAVSRLLQRVDSVLIPSSSSKPSMVSLAEGAALRRRVFEHFAEMLDSSSAQELVQSSLSSVKDCLQLIEGCRTSHDREGLIRAVHSLKGTLLNSGLAEEGASAASIEQLLKQSEYEEFPQVPLDVLVAKLQAYVVVA